MTKLQITLIILLPFWISSCGLSGLNETAKTKINTELNKYELNEVAQAKNIRNLFDNNWKQSKLFKYEDLSCTYCVILNENKELENLVLNHVFCDGDYDNNECQELLKLSKQTILNFIPLFKTDKYKRYPNRFCLSFGSDAGNKLYKKSIIKKQDLRIQ